MAECPASKLMRLRLWFKRSLILKSSAVAEPSASLVQAMAAFEFEALLVFEDRQGHTRCGLCNKIATAHHNEQSVDHDRKLKAFRLDPEAYYKAGWLFNIENYSDGRLTAQNAARTALAQDAATADPHRLQRLEHSIQLLERRVATLERFQQQPRWEREGRRGAYNDSSSSRGTYNDSNDWRH